MLAQVLSRVLYSCVVKFVTVGTSEGLGSLWAPCWVKNLVTNFLLHFGGIHSGCGISSFIWLIYSAVYLATDHVLFTVWVKIFGYALMSVVVLSCASAMPALRFKYHNVFEHAHRYLGWSALAVMLIFIILLMVDQRTTGGAFLGRIGYGSLWRQLCWLLYLGAV